MMFAQANSEHCRHKIFNADWVIDGRPQTMSLFGMIRTTHEKHPRGTVVAYADNAAVMEGASVSRFFPGRDGAYAYTSELTHTVMKVETHNHPTAISPFPGAATGAGGEIRDEGATGRGARPKAGLTGFSVSNLYIPDFIQPWELYTDGSNDSSPPASRLPPHGIGRPRRIASALQIMLEGPIGGASFNNEFGRPILAGYFRTFEQRVAGEVRGYHKPIMIAGGIGNLAAGHARKQELESGALLIQLGGPGMLIGLGGGAASSMDTGSNQEGLDFDSVQRGNAEIQRRAQEVIDRCWALGEGNPILTIHDVGAGGLSNALPELVHSARRGGRFELRKIPNEEPGMSPLQIWCNEAQERYVLAIAPADLERFRAICERERCPFALVGEATADGRLTVSDELFANQPVDMELAVLLGKPPKMTRDVTHERRELPPFDPGKLDPSEARGGLPRATVAGGRGQDLSHHHRRPHGRGAYRARPDGRSVAGPGGGCRRDTDGVRHFPRRGLCHGRAHAAGDGQSRVLGTHGGRRGDHQHHRRADCRYRRRQALGQLDGRRGTSRRGRCAVRYRPGCRNGPVP
jgi:phosphoribosylformylglycinamidine synthase